MKLRADICIVINPADTPTRDSVINFFNALKPKLLKLNLQETSRIVVQKCYHDETPVKPCEVILEWHKE